MQDKNAVFFYINGIPTHGAWVPMSDINTMGEVLDHLVKAGICCADYGGDILAACADFLCGPFCGRSDVFDMEAFVDCRDSEGEDEAKIAYMEAFGQWSSADFEDRYRGTGVSDEDFVYGYMEDTEWLAGVSDQVKMYIDWAALTRDMMITDLVSENGHFFSRG